MESPGVVSIDPYGPAAKELLRPLQPRRTDLARSVAEKLCDRLAAADKTAPVINRLRAAELLRLRQQQAEHIAMLLSADLAQSAHFKEALRAGKIHALVGVENLWLIESYDLYRDELFRWIRSQVADPDAREALMGVVYQRVLQDMQGQVSGYKEVEAETVSAFSKIDQHVVSTSNLTDLVRGSMAVIGGLSGNVSAFFARADESGELQIEQSYGSAAEQYHMAMESGRVPKISIDPTVVAGRGPGGRAWRSGKIVVSDAWLLDSGPAPWRPVGEELGFRSSAAVPLLDESGRSVALLSLYSSWPGFFSTGRARGFFSHVQHVLSHAVQRRVSAQVVPLRAQQAYRRMLEERRVVMLYQPIINLRDGSLAKFEALARMRSNDGELIIPPRFLPALGRDELLKLFEQGIRQAVSDCRSLESQAITADIAINFPAEGFDDPRYEEVLFGALSECDLASPRVQLEILETQDAPEGTQQRQAFIQRLREAGIRIAQDDLGSGHSSLLRLEQYPFDEVKIDQGLVRGALHSPKRAVEFILYLTRLAHAFDIPVTVEGLENPGMIEAAAILGADRGQGYGIGKPMPAADLAGWYRSFRYPIQLQKPRTAIGAMAGYLLWDLQLAAISERPELIEEFVGAKAIVDQFIKANKLYGGPIDQLLRQNQELAAATHSQNEDAKLVRSRLLKELTDYWLNESG